MVIETDFADNEELLGISGRAVITKDFKYIVYNKGEIKEQLFDLTKDPGEITNLAVNKSYKKKLIAMRSYLKQWCKKNGDTFHIRIINRIKRTTIMINKRIITLSLSVLALNVFGQQQPATIKLTAEKLHGRVREWPYPVNGITVPTNAPALLWPATNGKNMVKPMESWQRGTRRSKHWQCTLQSNAGQR